MGNVYLAEQQGLGRIVALKVIRPELRGSREATARFEREAQAIARLRHPNLVTVYGAGVEQGVHFLAMELVPGRGLDDLLARDPPPWRRAVGWAAQLARALAYAHAQGIVHRDVKPANIRITPDDRPLLLDFGVAYDMGADRTALTRTFAGSPAYAAPEQIDPRGGTVDGRTDVYALGVTLYQCLTGDVPFAADTVERVFARTLADDPPPPRQSHRGLPRDLDVVVLKAMEKEPARRYAGAAELADDLEAVLQHRPIRARPPGPAARLYKWTRRHPAWASACALLLAGLAAFAGLRLREAADRRREARALVARARAAIAAYQAEQRALGGRERRVRELRYKLDSNYMTADEDAELDRSEAEVDAMRRRRERVLYEVLDLLRQAGRLDPEVEGVGPVEAEVYLVKWEEAWSAHDLPALATYAALVEKADAGGPAAAVVKAHGTLSVTTDPPGAEVWLFRYRETPGARRLVPVPVGGAAPAAPGTWALRVVRGAGPVAAGDHLLRVAGHPVEGSVLVAGAHEPVRTGDRLVRAGDTPVRTLADAREARGTAFTFELDGARFTVEGESLQALGLEPLTPAALAMRGGAGAEVVHAGAAREIALPPGLVVRTTAAPAFTAPGCLLGRTPLPPQELPNAGHLLVLRREGCEEVRYPLLVQRGLAKRLHVRLNPLGTTPAGFVYVPAVEPGQHDFWIMEREVTAGEYLAFLNDPATLRRIDAAEKLPFVPRWGFRKDQAYWPRGADGRFALPDDWPADWPAAGVSWEDAQAYLAWASARDGRRYALPRWEPGNEGEWGRAKRGGDARVYVFGHVWRPKWCKSTFARRVANLEPVMSYPVDQSPLGVYDLTGSVAEWLDGWFDENRGMRKLGGGSWGDTNPLEWNGGLLPDHFSGETGFRMLFRREEGQ